MGDMNGVSETFKPKSIKLTHDHNNVNKKEEPKHRNNDVNKTEELKYRNPKVDQSDDFNTIQEEIDRIFYSQLKFLVFYLVCLILIVIIYHKEPIDIFTQPKVYHIGNRSDILSRRGVGSRLLRA